MATLVSEQIRWMADQYVNHCGYKSAVLSGIVPDKRHLDNGGFHCSVEDLRRFGNGNDFSNSRPDDRNFNIKYGAGVDVSMSPADMRLHHKRVHAVWKDKTDPRRKYINAINTWDGSGDAVRLDFVANTAKYATPDHKWHAHDETRRRYLLSWKAARAKVSVWKGEPKTAWIAREEQPTSAKETTVADIPVQATWGQDGQVENWPWRWDHPDQAAKVGKKGNPRTTARWALWLAADQAHWANEYARLAYAEAKASKLATEAVLAAVKGDDNTQILARIDEVAAQLAKLPAEVVDALADQGRAPEEIAAVLQALLGDRAGEVGRLLIG